ncbi:hypothetical protein HY971_02450 [Candidatus Kaiserbacteria bacterium]|nr:hypothetical protein [Candidatus Kaiserbacteria bacterium]
MDITLIICAHNEESVIGETVDIAKNIPGGNSARSSLWIMRLPTARPR